jgi:hypothetical protein
MDQHQDHAMFDVTFVVGDQRYATRAGALQIVHEAFHAALPVELTVGHRLTFASESGDELFADNFIGEIVARYGTATMITTVEPIPARTGHWRNVGFDHLAITVADRSAARDFFRDILQMQVMRDDEHLTVLATGPTALFLFDASQEAPLSTGQPSTWHHLGFVADDLEAAYAHLYAHRDRLVSDFTLLERDERWSLYCFYRNGDVTFMIQLSEIKAAERGITDPARVDFPTLLYDYASRPYGEQFGAVQDKIGDGTQQPGRG